MSTSVLIQPSFGNPQPRKNYSKTISKRAARERLWIICIVQKNGSGIKPIAVRAMHNTVMAKPKKSGSRKSQSGTSARASSRLHRLLKLADEVTSAAGVQCSQTSGIADAGLVFDRQILLRALEAIKAVRLLVANSHWEVAAAPTRQIFELLINMEYLSLQPNRTTARGDFFRFGQLQSLQAKLGNFEYERDSGRPVNMDLLADIEDALDDPQFDQFRLAPAADGSRRWRTSWNSKNAREMSELSMHPMRKFHYQLLFRTWSEQAHGSPGILFAQMQRYDAAKEDPELFAGDVQARSIEIVSMAITQFINLWCCLTAFPAPDTYEVQMWFARQRVIASPLVRSQFVTK
ncbi:DUF5677 domain-containing protein (plasmid) [Rhodococcus qingshengii]|uniref:DUF5677 domain-containing protein n=1 Tax=Rhodococcus qingshengii TaxID=334542 RepID=UPI002112D939|nr:DUF5677 domain-containing protein [Rhodococcus qingshengii]UUE28486.1 DUF5677 domain-containing protein [Rhodococcus qingshengii]